MGDRRAARLAAVDAGQSSAMRGLLAEPAARPTRLYALADFVLSRIMTGPALSNGTLVEVAEQYAAEAAACWTLRDAAARSPAYDLLELSELDDRVERHLEGLHLAGDLGWELCAAALDSEEPGEVFAAAALSLARGDWQGFALVLDVAGGDPSRAHAIVSALGWTGFDGIAIALEALLAEDVEPALHCLGVAGYAIHRRDPGRGIERAATSSEDRLRSRALRAIGELHRADLGHVLASNLSHEDDACRFWASWSAALLHDERATGVLQALSEAGGPFAARAADMTVRRMDPAAARAWLESLPNHGKAATRAALVGAAALGDPALMPLLFAHLRREATARPAAWSMSLITNADVTGELGAAAPSGFVSGPTADPADPDVAMDADEELPWPNPDRLEAWWRGRENELSAGTRYLFGRPMGSEWLAHVLRHGNQGARAAAAVELCLRSRGQPLFEVRAPGYLQWGSLPNGAR